MTFYRCAVTPYICQEAERFQYDGNKFCFTSSQESNRTNYIIPVASVFTEKILGLKCGRVRKCSENSGKIQNTLSDYDDIRLH